MLDQEVCSFGDVEIVLKETDKRKLGVAYLFFTKIIFKVKKLTHDVGTFGKK